MDGSTTMRTNSPFSPRIRTIRRKPFAGVTLLELMVVLVVIAVLAATALPSYRRYTMRAQRTDAKTALLRLATNQERFYIDHRRYGATADLAALGFATGLSESGAYRISVPAADATTYTATATPVGGGAFDMRDDDECASFSITAQGVRTAAPDPSGRCW